MKRRTRRTSLPSYGKGYSREVLARQPPMPRQWSGVCFTTCRRWRKCRVCCSGPHVPSRRNPRYRRHQGLLGEQLRLALVRLGACHVDIRSRGSSGRPSLTLIQTPSPGKTYTTLREKMTSPISSWFGRGKSSGRDRSATITSTSMTGALRGDSAGEADAEDSIYVA